MCWLFERMGPIQGGRPTGIPAMGDIGPVAKLRRCLLLRKVVDSQILMAIPGQGIVQPRDAN